LPASLAEGSGALAATDALRTVFGKRGLSLSPGVAG
jgi:hypothetical protein